MNCRPFLRGLLVLLISFVAICTTTAQTASDPNEGSRLTYDSALGSYGFSWWGQPGRTYFIQHSDDLSAWEYLPLIESGTDTTLAWGFTSTTDRFFLRLRRSDIPTADPFTADFDGDHIGNWAELLQGTDPLSAVDTDGSDLPDDWEQFYFGHLGVDPNAPSPGDSSMTNLHKFLKDLNPNTDDTDGDGVPDGSDGYPGDGQRSAELPLVTYAIIDISGGSQDGHDVWAAALNDVGQAAFVYADDYGEQHPFTWLAGEPTVLSALPLQDASGGFTRELAAGAMNAAGTLAGSLHAQRPDPDFPDSPEEHYSLFSFAGGTVTESADGIGFATSIYGLSENGTVIGDYHPESYYGLAGPVSSATTFYDDPFYPSSISRGGVVGGKLGFESQHAALWLPGWESPLDLGTLLESSSGSSQLLDVNDSQEAVGISDAPADPVFNTGSSAFLFTNGNLLPFLNVIPATYQGQVNFSGTTSAKISNAGHVLLNGSSLEGPDKAATWNSGWFLWNEDGPGAAEIRRAILPAGWSLRIQGINSAGMILALGVKQETDAQGQPATNPDGTPKYETLQRAVLLPLVEFTTSDIIKGFDYPLQGDPPDPSSPMGQHNGEKDTKRSEWWTSIGQGPIYGEGLDVSDHVKADVGSDDAADLFTIRVKPGDDLIIGLSPTELSGKETLLTITGKNLPLPLTKQAQIEIVDQSTPPQVVRTLNVLSLVKWDVPVRICYVYDPAHDVPPPATGNNPTEIRIRYRISEEIINHLNRTFRQACVQFYSAYGSGVIPLRYDEDLDGKLDRGSGDLSLDTEMQPFLDSGYFDENMLTIFVVSRFQQYYSNGYLPGSSLVVAGFNAANNRRQSRWVFINSELFTESTAPPYHLDGYLNACAHEIGHALGISTRNYGGPSGRYSDFQHDAGAYPLRYGNTKTLMDPAVSDRSQDIWIRSEDWQRANQGAQDLFTLPP